MSKIKALGLEDGPWLRELLAGKKMHVKGIEVDPQEVLYRVKGKKLAIVADTVFCNNIFLLVDEVDVAIVECTLMMEKEERADAVKHMTTKNVADIANQSTAKRVIATHFSQRYKDIGILEDELKDFAPDAECAYDFMKVKF
jgi:ribonuclease Z